MKNCIFGVLCAVGLIFAIALVGYLYSENRKLAAEIRKQETALASARQQNDSAQREIKNIKDDFEQKLAVLREQKAPNGDIAFENALELWLTRVRNLSAYLKKHPELRISQMVALTEEDWLDITKGRTFETEADYRKCLGELRGHARQKFGAIIGDAYKAAVQANGDTAVRSAQDIVAFLPSGFDRAHLANLEYNQNGEMKGLRGGKGFNFIEKPVDIWDATLFYSKDGGYGMRSANVKGEDSVVIAIKQYRAEYGRNPVNGADLVKYNSGLQKIDKSLIDELVTAHTRKL